MEQTLKSLWIVLTVFIAALVLFLVAFGIPAALSWKGSFVPARTITVSTEGMTTATPDEADINFSVLTQGTDPQTLSNNNNMKMSAVLQFVSSQGIASSDIATTGYDLEPNYQWDKNTNRNFITGYTLTQTVQVKIRDLTKVAAVLGGLAPLGVNQIGGVNFTFQDPNKFVAIARGDALAKAADQAGQMAGQAGASLGEVVNINESHYIPGPQPVYGMSSAGMGVAMNQAAAPSIQPGTQDVTDTVTVTYELK
jgi:uncharacterized protein YggE